MLEEIKLNLIKIGIIAVALCVGMFFLALGGSVPDDSSSGGGSSSSSGGYSNASGLDFVSTFVMSWENSDILDYKQGKITESRYISGDEYVCYTDFATDHGDRNFSVGVCHRTNWTTYNHVEKYKEVGIEIDNGNYDSPGVSKIKIEYTDYVYEKLIEEAAKTIEQIAGDRQLTDGQLSSLISIKYQYGNVAGLKDFLDSGGNDRDAFWVNDGYGGYWYPFSLTKRHKPSDARVNANWNAFCDTEYKLGTGEVVNPEDFNSTTNNSEFYSFDDFLFIGDSYTVALEGNQDFKNAKLLAEVGKTPKYWIDNFNKIEEEATNEPKAVCILLGVNGVQGSNQIRNMEELIDKLISNDYYRTIPIYVQAVFPVSNKYTTVNYLDYNTSIDAYNTAIKDYCSSKSNVTFIDTTEGCCKMEGKIKTGKTELYANDGLHLNNNGRSIWINNMKEKMLSK